MSTQPSRDVYLRNEISDYLMIRLVGGAGFVDADFGHDASRKADYSYVRCRQPGGLTMALIVYNDGFEVIGGPSPGKFGDWKSAAGHILRLMVPKKISDKPVTHVFIPHSRFHNLVDCHE